MPSEHTAPAPQLGKRPAPRRYRPGIRGLRGRQLFVIGAGLAVSLAILAATLPLPRRITGPETARNE